MFAIHIEKIKRSMLCATGVYLRDITSTIFVILQLNVNRLSVCFSYLSCVNVCFLSARVLICFHVFMC